MSNKPTYKELEKENKRLREKLNSEIKDNRFDSYFENNQAVMLQIDVETKQIIKANNAAVNFYKYPEEELLKKTINDLNILSASEIQKRMSEAIKNKSNIFEFQHKTAEGEIKDVEVYASPFKDGTKTFIYVIIHDISERKKIEKRLLKSETYFKSLTENSSDVISVIDKNGKSLYRSPSYEKVMGFSAEEMLGKNVFNFIHPDDKEKLRKQIQESLSKPNQVKKISFKALHKDGTYHYLEGTGKNLLNTPINGIVINYRDVTQEYTSQESLKESEKKYQDIFDYATIGILITDIKDMKFISANPAICEMFGYSEKEFTKLSVNNIYPKDDLEFVVSEFKAQAKKEKVLATNIPCLRKDGTVFYANINTTTTFIDGIECNISFFNDITEQKENATKLKIQNEEYASLNEEYKSQNEALKKAKEKTEESEQRFKDLTNLLPQIIYECDIEGNLTYVNEQAFEFFRYTKKDFEKGINLMQTLIPEDHEKAKNAFQKVLQGEEPENPNYTALRKDGTTFPVLIFSSVTLKNKKPVGLRGVIIDITDLKKAQEETLKAKEKAEENEAKFKSIFELSPQPISISNLSGILLEVNNKLCEISGFTKNELINRNVVDIGFYSKEARKYFLDILKEKGYTENLELKFYNKAKKEINTLTNATIIKLNGVPHLLSMVTDITKRKKAEAEIIKAKERAEESDRLKTEFINNMSHEIRTPMNGILGFSELLSSQDLTPEKQKNYINIIQNSGKQLMRIIDDILEISKLGTKQVKAINEKICLNDLLLELFSIFDIKAKENKTPLYFKKGLSDKESVIFTDSLKLSKILSNLLENALKFTNTGSIEFGYKLIHNKIEIFVKDTGIGIKSEKQETIFERFSQEEKEVSEHAGGLGLGLSIAKENAELLGGTITLESEKGKGSTFYITIPYRPVAKNNITKAKKANMENKKTNTILVVEDEEVNFIYIETLLEYFEKDIIVLHATDGKQAVDFCKKRSDIDFVLMDLKMPVMDGYEATKEIKTFRPNLPIIAQTAYSTPEEKAKAMTAGCDDFISKPISKEIFSKVIDKYKVT